MKQQFSLFGLYECRLTIDEMNQWTWTRLNSPAFLEWQQVGAQLGPSPILSALGMLSESGVTPERLAQAEAKVAALVVRKNELEIALYREAAMFVADIEQKIKENEA